MNENFQEITIVIISHKSKDLVLQFIKEIPKKVKILIIDNSNDKNLNKEILEKKNCELHLIENNGYGAAINFARKKIHTKYFFVFSPDVKTINGFFISEFLNEIKNIKEFGAIGPRFINVTEKSHKQSDINKKIGEVKSIVGSAMLFQTNIFDKIGGFDENIFLYFEETDFNKRARRKGYKILQLNTVIVQHAKGLNENTGVVKINNEAELIDLENLYSWHFIWSKFYFYKKYYGKLLSTLIFIPTLIRIFYRIFYYSKIKNDIKKKQKYYNRLDGFLASFKNKKSYKRPITI